MNGYDARRDFNGDARLLPIGALGAAIGACSVGTAWLLLHAIHLFTNLFFFQTWSDLFHSPAANTLGAWVIGVPVLGGLVIGLIARYGSEQIRGHGIPEAIEAILFKRSAMSPKVAVLKPLASAIAIGSGGPFGAEGPIIMTGGAIGSLVAQHFHLSGAERKTLLVAGAVAGMTAVFGTPIAALLLAVELLLFELRPRSLLPVALACAVAGFLRPLILDAAPLFPQQTQALQPLALLSCAAAGLVCGALAWAMSTALYRIEDAFHALPIHWMWWPALGGLAVGIGGYFQPRALGVGYDVIADLLNHHLAISAVLALLAVKAVIWLIALGSGTSGGVLAPLLMLGAGLGAVIAWLIPGSDPTLWPLVCMAAVLAGVLGAPLTAAVFALGLTGDFNALLPLLLATGISYGFTVLVMRRSIMTEKIARRGLHIYREYSVDPQERMFVEEVMTREVMWIAASASLKDIADDYFGSTQRHRAFPVCDDSGKLLGMLDRAALYGYLDAHAKAAGTTAIGDLLVPSTSLLAVATETCQSVTRRMAAHHVERLPVVADAASLKLIGLISRSDLVKPAHTVFHEEHVRERLAR